MKMYDLGVTIIIVVVSICIAGGLLSTLWLGKDNVIEEAAEKVIERETGIDIDLTPSSKEVLT